MELFVVVTGFTLMIFSRVCMRPCFTVICNRNCLYNPLLWGTDDMSLGRLFASNNFGISLSSFSAILNAIFALAFFASEILPVKDARLRFLHARVRW